jgi:hypothetical protein
MTPKEKAKELVDKMYQHQWRKDTIEFRNAKQCALITCEEMIYGIEEAFEKYEKHKKTKVANQIFYWDFWSDVQLEIEKL